MEEYFYYHRIQHNIVVIELLEIRKGKPVEKMTFCSAVFAWKPLVLFFTNLHIYLHSIIVRKVSQ